MEQQKFMPEGWDENFRPVSKEYLTKAMDQGIVLQSIVKKCDANYNLHIDFGNNMTGIIPREEIEAINLDETGFPKPNICITKVNKYVQFKVKDIDSNDKFILSRKDVGLQAKQWMKNELTQGMVVNGIVKNIRPYGVFVDIGGGIIGLLHVEDLSVARVKSPEERLKVGQKIKVKVKEVDKKLERVVLSYKEMLGTWEDNIKEFEENSTVIGIARETEKSKNGIFVELTPNLVGLAEYKDNIEYGQKVSVFIKKIIHDKKKVKLLIV